jgi:hypothetical protein
VLNTVQVFKRNIRRHMFLQNLAYFRFQSMLHKGEEREREEDALLRVWIEHES